MLFLSLSLVCEIRDGLPTIVASSAFTCYQEILTEVNENIQEVLTEVDNIQEILTEVDGNGDNMLVTPGFNFKWNEKQQDIECNIDIELKRCLFSIKFICQRGQRNK